MRNESVPESIESAESHQVGLAGGGGTPPKAPALNNMGPWKFQGSEDTIHLACYVEWDGDWEKTVAFLEERKQAAGDDDGDGGFFDLGGWECEVKEHGAGGGNRGPRRAFIIDAVGLRFEIARTQSPNGETPNVRLLAGSLICMQIGPLGVLKLATEFIEALGGRFLANKLSRIDAAVDLPLIEVSEFIRAYHEGRYLCRGQRCTLHGHVREMQTIVIGESPQLRIYDKSAELFAKLDQPKIFYIAMNRWGGELQAISTRVEFQLRRDDIKSMTFDGQTINSLEDYLACRSGVWSYMCNWFRVTKEPVDENHRDRAETSPLWQDVTDSFVAWATSPLTSVCRFKRARPIDEKSLNAMAVGCGLSACANDDEFNLVRLKRKMAQAVDEAVEEHGVEELQRRWWTRRQRELVAQAPERDRRGRSVPRVQSFESWLAEEDAYRQAVENAGGQMPIHWPNDPLQFVDFKTIVGD